MRTRNYLMMLVLICAAVLLPLLVSAETGGACGDNLTWTLQDDGTLVISGTGAMYSARGDWTGGLKAEEVFSIRINPGVTMIGNHAFHGCINASGTVVIPDSVKVISTAAFSYCTALTEIVLPDSLTNIQAGAFHTYDGVYKRGEIPALRVVPTIDGNAAKALSRAGYTFRHASYPLIDLRYLYDGETQTDFALVSANPGITEVKWPEGITKISANAFKNCKSLSTVDIPDTVHTIDTYAFLNCVELKSVVIPNGVTVIRQETFQACYKLESVTIPDTVTSIEPGAFSHCDTLKELHLSDNLTTVQAGAFHTYDGVYKRGEIPALRFVPTLNGAAAMALSGVGYSFRLSDYPNLSFRCTVDAEGKGTEFRVVGADAAATACTVPKGVTHIGTSAFAKCSGLTAVKLPVSLKTVEKYAFSGLSRLTAVYYDGSETEWAAITIEEGNEPLTVAALHCNTSMDEPVQPEPERFTVTFDANGGEGGMAAVSVIAGEKYQLPECAFTAPEGKEFDRWDLGVIGDEIEIAADTVITAQWKDKAAEVCAVTFDANGGAGSMAAVSVNSGEKYQLPECAFTAPEGKEFDRWDLGAIGDEIEITADTVVTARWKEKAKPEKVPVTSVKLNKTEASLAITLKEKNPAVQLKATVAPKNATQSAVTWKSSNAKVAKVSKTGKVTAVAAGTCKITATAADGSGKKATCTVTVKLNEISVSGLNYKLDHKKLTASVTGPTKKTITKVVIPETVKANGKTYKVTVIAKAAFKDLKISSLELGKNVTTIEKEAFSGCTSIKTITVKGSEISTIGKAAFKDLTIKVKLYLYPSMQATYIKKLVKLLQNGGIREVYEMFR